jgi:hypothetical protein
MLDEIKRATTMYSMAGGGFSGLTSETLPPLSCGQFKNHAIN